jgi:pimeloyl-ACP methyl ester carboxylesterase
LVGTDRSLRLADGRTVPVWEGGDPDGMPVLFHSGTPSGRLQATLAHEAAVSSGVRLLSFNRPGYGAATGLPPGLRQVGIDGVAILEQLGVAGYAVLGVSGGGPYALATALADQARCLAVGIAAGIGPWVELDEPDADDPERPIVEQARSGDLAGATTGLAALAASEFSWLRGDLADDDVVDGFFDGVPASALTWLDPTARRRWAADTRDALTTYDGYVRDNLSWAADWDIDPAELRVPTTLWYGDADVVVPPSHGTWLVGQLPNARLVVRTGVGHGEAIFGHLGDMLTTLTGRDPTG